MSNAGKVEATLKAEKMIAYRDRDAEGDIWCERVFLFKDDDDARAFFTDTNDDLLNIYTDEDDRTLHDFNVNEINCSITGVTFFTEYAGDVRIYVMAEGFLIK